MIHEEKYALKIEQRHPPSHTNFFPSFTLKYKVLFNTFGFVITQHASALSDRMKFREIFRFELAYQLRTPWPWLFFTILIVLNFLMTRDATLSEALYEEFIINSPFAIAKTTVFGNLLWLVMAAFITGDSAARDAATRMHALVFTLPLHKAHYLAGRFFAAFLLNALILSAVQVAIALAIYSPGVDPSIIAPFSPLPYLTAYVYIGLPTAFAATSIQFAFALATQKSIAAYAGSVLLVFMGFFVASILLFKRVLGTLLDPIGIRFVVEDMSHLWTTVEKNYRPIRLEGVILENRIFWIGIGIIFLTFAYWRFNFKHFAQLSFIPGIANLRSNFFWHKTIKRDVALADSSKAIAIEPTFGFATQLRQTSAITISSFKMLIFSWTGLALLVAIPLMTIIIVIDQMEVHSGQLVPTTIRVLRELTSPLSAELSRWVIIPAFIIFFAGELIWRERDARTDELTDSIAVSEWIALLGKFFGLTLMLFAFTTFQMVAGMLAQLALNYDKFEIDLYVKILFGFQLSEYLLFAILVFVIHVVVDQKYLGHMIAIVCFVFLVLSQLFGIEHNMLVFGASPEWSYTDMRGFGNSMAPWVWFKLYWLAWGLVLMIIARLLWVRGASKSFRTRVRMGRQRFAFPTRVLLAVSALMVLVTGGYVFYNTNILHKYQTGYELKQRRAAYENRYGKFKSIVQPHLAKAKLKIELYTDKKKADIKGVYTLVNQDPVSIDSIHVATNSNFRTSVAFDRMSVMRNSDEDLNYEIHELEQPLEPGDSLQLSFEISAEDEDFRESGASNAIVANGTYFSNSWFPAIGYQQSRELIHSNDRRDFKLSARPIIASLYDARELNRHRGGIQLEVLIGTDEGQMAGAPGELKRKWSENKRNYFHYKTDGAIGNEWAFFSAKYTVHEEKWRPSDSTQEVIIRVFHMPEHTTHLGRMLESIRASLNYYSKTFGAYPYHHLTVAEGAGEGTGLHAEASMLTHSEGFSLWNAESDSLGFDFPFAVVAHEMAHQWTVPYASVEGAPVMSESIAWYYAMKLVEHAKGPAHLKALLHTMRQPHPYPPIRRGEPLLRGLDPYLSYRRGPFALYTLSEYVGEKQINHALHELLQTHRKPGAPLATTLDLYRQLNAVTPDSLKYLLHDFFKVNSYWELKAERVTSRQSAQGKWNVEVELQAHKIMSDSAGVETEIPMNDWIEVGLFGAGRGPAYLEKHLLHSGKQTLKITVEQKPEKLVIDPNHLMIDLKTEDNSLPIRK